MELHELAIQYRESSRLCSERAALLRTRLKDSPESSSGEMLALRQRILILESMARDARATSKYLENYYRRPAVNAEKENSVRKRDRGAQLEALCKEIREAGKQCGRAHSRGA